MLSVRRSLTAAACLGGLTLLTGCPSESLISAALKVANAEMTTLTENEVQFLVNAVSNASPDVNVSLSDEQAQGVVDFLYANQLDSIEDIEAAVQCAQSDPNCLEVPESVQLLIDSGDLPEVQGG